MRKPSSFLRAGAVACLVLSGCDRDTPTEPASGVDGAWRGTITRGAVAGTITMQLTQSGAGVTGTWTADLGGLEFDQSGSAGGTVAGSTVSLFLSPEAPLTCASGTTLSGTLALNGSVTGDRLVGDSVVFACNSAVTGRIDMTRD